MAKIVCPLCGEINKSDVILYDTELRKQNFELSPIHPTCTFCKSAVKINKKCDGGKIIVLNGTCGSGKSSVAIELMNRHGYYAIDGDCVNQSVKHRIDISDPDFKAKVQFNSDETLAEIAAEIDYISLYSDKIVLSHVILPDDIGRYIKIFAERNLYYHFFLLKPSYEEAIRRCQTRTCHKTITPESYVRYYYDILDFSNHTNVTIIDNTNMTIDETVQYLDFKGGLR